VLIKTDIAFVMKTRVVYLLFILLVALSSCQKEVTDPNLESSNGDTGNTAITFLPLTKNTYWKYQDSASGDVTTMTVLDQTKTINGRLFTAVLGSNSIQADTVYMAKQDHDYFTYAEVNNGTSSGTLLFHFLNDTAAVGQSWEYLAGQGNGFTAYFKTTVVERSLSRTVHGKTYTNVIHTTMELSYDIGGQRLSAGTYDYFTAQDVGIIQSKANLGMSGFDMTVSSDLIDYQIK
jgi:hypothetical protein